MGGLPSGRRNETLADLQAKQIQEETMIWVKGFFWLLLGVIVLTAILNGRKRGWRLFIYYLLIGIDEFFNALLGGLPGETISSRCNRGKDKRWYWRILAAILNSLQKDHTVLAEQNIKEDAFVPPELRK
jgi:uncharacterized membrane protein YsdA (DUF1294 family)